MFTKGHTLLERYGMTEIGMALSNPLRGPRLAVRCNNHLANHIVSIIIHAFRLVPLPVLLKGRLRNDVTIKTFCLLIVENIDSMLFHVFNNRSEMASKCGCSV